MTPTTLAKPAPALTPVSFQSSVITYYDIESLSNVFSLVAYTPRPGQKPSIEIFHLIDTEDLRQALTFDDLERTIYEQNPGLPQSTVVVHDLRTTAGAERLATLLGLSDAENVGDRESECSYGSRFRPVCTTDLNTYDPQLHPFFAGYNSKNYDTTMLAELFSRLFAPYADRNTRVREARGKLAYAKLLKNPQDIADAQALLVTELEAIAAPAAVTASEMRTFNDTLFTAENIKFMPGVLGWGSTPGLIRNAMLRSGRHIDIAQLNEHQKMVALKRLLGMLGYQVKESEKLGADSTINNIEELLELLSYNVSDCLGLSQLAAHPVYANAFDLKAGLLSQYFETAFTKWGSPRRDRLTIDSSSAQFVGRILAPDKPLNDIASVSYMYPDPEIAAERGVTPVNVLDEAVAFFERDVTPDRATNQAQAKAHADFMRVVKYYREIEGKNFNDSQEYRDLFGNAALPAHSLREITMPPNNLHYIQRDGSTSSCFVTFSYGGIHGAEVNLSLFTKHQHQYAAQEEMLAIAKKAYPDARAFVARTKAQQGRIPLGDGTFVDKALVLLGSDPEKVRYRKPKAGDAIQIEQLERAQRLFPEPADLLRRQRPADQALQLHDENGRILLDGKTILQKTTQSGATYREEVRSKVPQIFVPKKKIPNSTELNPTYRWTSVGRVTHEDFSSYYPNLLRNMRAFYNKELGEDRYAAIFFQKEDLGKRMKDQSLSSEERNRLAILREGTKLILNSASGAGDAGHKNPIRMNNRIISMRIIGQVLSWRIGQAQTLEGARIISTNTDGLYSVLDEEVNNRVLAEQAELIGIDIEPEPMFLISKDTNNRLELTPPRGHGTDLPVELWDIHNAGGGDLACHEGPTPRKSLAHPAVIDHALARYLQTVATRGDGSLTEPFDEELGRSFLQAALDLSDPVKTALLFQNMVVGSRGSITYPFAAAPLSAADTAEESTGDAEEPAAPEPNPIDDPDSGDEDETEDMEDSSVLRDIRALPVVNRMFIVREGTPGAVSLHAASARKVPPATLEKRRKGEVPPALPNPIAADMLRKHGWATSAADLVLNSKLVRVPTDQDVQVRKLPRIDPHWSVLLCNDDMHAMDQSRLVAILQALDLDKYLGMLNHTYTKNWRNVV